MTSKVEQLRAEMLDERRWLLPKNPVEDGKGIANIDALISAAHAEGVAEGAEEMKATIREAAFGVFDDVGTQFVEGVRVIYIGKPIPIFEKGAAFVPACVLAPTKEEP